MRKYQILCFLVVFVTFASAEPVTPGRRFYNRRQAEEYYDDEDDWRYHDADDEFYRYGDPHPTTTEATKWNPKTDQYDNDFYSTSYPDHVRNEPDSEESTQYVSEHDNSIRGSTDADEDVFEETTGIQEDDCSSDGQILPVIASNEIYAFSCYKFKICNLMNESFRSVEVTCPIGLEWKQGTTECQIEQESCRVQRLRDHTTPDWLNRLLSCPTTSSLSNLELNEIHKLRYYLALNGSAVMQADRQTDFLTPIVMETGIFRHVLGLCSSYFKCRARLLSCEVMGL